MADFAGCKADTVDCLTDGAGCLTGVGICMADNTDRTVTAGVAGGTTRNTVRIGLALRWNSSGIIAVLDDATY